MAAETVKLACHCGAPLVLARLQRWQMCPACGRWWRATVGLETMAADSRPNGKV